jgi:hypothetical protein
MPAKPIRDEAMVLFNSRLLGSWALLCLLLSLSQQASLNHPLHVLPARNHGWIYVENPRPTRPQRRFSEAWNSIRLAPHLSSLLSSTVR